MLFVLDTKKTNQLILLKHMQPLSTKEMNRICKIILNV